ncbi:hypothetical protein J2X77_002111 [Sphingobacterium sp. 2149]|nr:hypothetical protein [Sphingobacterium sp. 2149]
MLVGFKTIVNLEAISDFKKQPEIMIIPIFNFNDYLLT